jgi:hypothetical protein
MTDNCDFDQKNAQNSLPGKLAGPFRHRLQQPFETGDFPVSASSMMLAGIF